MGTEKKRKLREEEGAEVIENEETSHDTSTSSSESSLVSSEDDSEGCAFESIDVDFEFFDPDEGDFHGMKTLLTNYLDGTIYKCSELVENVIATPGSTVIKCGDEGNVVGVAGVIRTNADIYNYAKSHCPESLIESFKSLVEGKNKENVRCILIERLVNSPPQLAPPLLDAILVPEVQQHVDTYYVMGRGYKSGDSELIFALPEYEFLYNVATVKFDFMTPNRGAYVEKNTDNLHPARFVAVLDTRGIQKACKDMKKVIDEIR